MTQASMASPRAVSEALAALEIRPRKRWGQHFLIDGNTVDRIMAAADLADSDPVLEIGPGLGVLTERSAKAVHHLLAIEVDPKLAAWLVERFENQPNVRIVEGDALHLDWAELMPSQGHWKALGNLPYNIASPLLDRLIEHRDRIDRAVWTVQREVADKLLATPGTRATNSLGMVVQAFCQVERVFNVSKNAFYPAPEVESVVLKITPREAPIFQAPEFAFRQTVRAAYGVRRKTIRRALSIGLDIATEKAGQILRQAGIDDRRRGETLTLEEFDRVAQAVASTLDLDAIGYGEEERHSSSAVRRW